ncbi:CPBP family intramembrane glutamic endopeptidase [Halococcoides cellulosivorans]|nr:CPBP family intramembrane glutamic endopeptidase [Halococcoides cellulosivorans]
MSIPLGVERLASSNDRLRAVLTVLALFVVAMIAMVVVGATIRAALIWGGAESEAMVLTALAMAAGEVVAFALVAGGYLRSAGPSVSIDWPSRREAGVIVGAVVLATALGAAQRAVLGELDPETTAYGADLVRAAPVVYAVLAIVGAVLAPIVEELLFRGAIQGRLRTVTGPVGAIGGASLLFVPLHLTVAPGSPLVALLGASMIGLTSVVFGVAYERTGTLTVPIVVHAASNAVFFVLIAGRVLL